MIKRILLLALLISTQAFAGLPPTTAKDSADSTDITSFKFRFPNFTGTHTGTLFTLGIDSVAGGGTGLGTLTANSLLVGAGTGNVTFIAPGSSGTVLQSNGTTASFVSGYNGVAVAMQATGTPAAASANNPVIFPTVTYDTSSAYSSTTGKYTAPNTALYHVCTFIAGNNGPGTVNIYINGVINIPISTIPAVTLAAGGCGDVSVTATQTIDVRITSGQSVLGQSQLSISQIH